MSKVVRNHSSIKTISAMLNSMLGGALLTFPVLYKSAGLITSTIMLFVSAIISFMTCRIYTFHAIDADKDVQATIRRIMGKKWQRIFRLITGVYLIFLCIVYIDLIVDQLYSMIQFFQHQIAQKDQFTFSKFSQQYLTLIMIIPFWFLVSLKNLNFVVKIAAYGAITIVIYFIFVIYQFINAAATNTIDMSQVALFSLDIGNLAGTCSLALTIHTVVVSFLQPNKNQQNNTRDLGIAYLIGFILYTLIGILGAISISNLDCKQTFVNCHLKQWSVLIVEIAYLIGRVTAFPCTLQVSRIRILQVYYQKIEDRHLTIFNISFLIVGTIFSILSPFIPLTLMMNFIGAVICYFFIYMIPTLLHFQSLYGSKAMVNEQSLIKSMISADQQQTTTGKSAQQQLKIKQYAASKPKILRLIIYAIINIIGIAIGVYGVYTCIKSISQ